MASRLGDLKKEKRFSVRKTTIFCKLCGDLQKKGLLFWTPPFSATFVYQIKNYTNLFGGQTKQLPSSEIEINFFNNLPAGQVISNVYLPEKLSTCPKKNRHHKFWGCLFLEKNL